MSSRKQGARSLIYLPIRIGSRIYCWLIVIKQTQGEESRPLLPPLPESLLPQRSFNTNEQPGGSGFVHVSQAPADAELLNVGFDNNLARKLDQAVAALQAAGDHIASLSAALAQQEAARQEAMVEERHFRQSINSQISELTSVVKNIEEERHLKRARKRNVDLELQLAAVAPADPNFNWMFGDGVTPKIGQTMTRSQNRFMKLKTYVKQSAVWFMYEASDADLIPTFIQFLDTPRIGVDGLTVKKMLLEQMDACEHTMGALVRVLRKYESTRDPDSKVGRCYYVSHKWTAKVLAGGTMTDCLPLFQQPKPQCTFAGCTRVVAFLKLDCAWASVSVDLQDATTHLVHPFFSSARPEAVLAHYDPMMREVTGSVISHMRMLGQIPLPSKEWVYDVAFKQGQPCNLYDSGFAAAFYSIPKDEQFMVVSHDTLRLAKQTFLYDLHRMCQPVTKQRVRKGNLKLVPRDRTKDGTWAACSNFDDLLDVEGEHNMPSESGGCSRTGSHAPIDADMD